MAKPPWSSWIPGVLCKEQVLQLCSGGYLTETGTEPRIDHSSIDLHLADEAFELTDGSIKPTGRSYLHFAKKHALATPLLDSSGYYTLEPRRTYLFRIRERIAGLGQSGIYGQVTAKSTIGRVDVLARLVVDGMSNYEGFTPEELDRSSGDMFLEVTSMTFRVRVTKGVSLSQLRLFYGRPSNSEIHGPELWNSVLHTPEGDRDRRSDDTISVDLRDETVAGERVAAFEVSDQTAMTETIDLWDKPESERPDPCKYWRFRRADANTRLKIQERSFYILRSKDRLSLPKGVAAYCRAIDETIGEMRIHYAGFVHPFFGTGRPDEQLGTPLIFEVRGHDLNVSLIDGEKMARLTFYRMSEDATQEANASYNEQELTLSKFFRPWPPKVQVGMDGSVQPA